MMYVMSGRCFKFFGIESVSSLEEFKALPSPTESFLSLPRVQSTIAMINDYLYPNGVPSEVAHADLSNGKAPKGYKIVAQNLSGVAVAVLVPEDTDKIDFSDVLTL